MFDWQTEAPTRCYLCGLNIANGKGDRDHFVPRALFEHGKLPNETGRPEPLPSHTVCNRSTSRDEQRVAISWATVRPVGFGSQERWDRAIRALKRPQAERLKASFLAHLVKLPHGARLTIPGRSAHYVIAKIVRGLLYRQSGHVFGPHVRWFIRQSHLSDMVENDGVVFDFPGALTAKCLVVPDDPDTTMTFLAIHGIHVISAFTFPAQKESSMFEGEVPEDTFVLSWPRVWSEEHEG
jgi:hypothetical protein